MEPSRSKAKQYEKATSINTYSVPFDLEEIKESLTITLNTPSKPSKDQIIKQAFKFHSEGNILEASKYYQHFINQGFKDHRVFANYGVILQGLGKSQEAELSLRKAIEINPNFANVHYNLGSILKDLGRSQEAELSLRKAIEIKPDYAIAHYNLGNILTDLGKLQEAELSYRKTIEIKPDYADAHSNLGNILKDLDKLQEAQLSYNRAIEINPHYAEVHSNLGSILKDLGKLEEAELSYCKAIEIKPDFAIAHYNLGNILRELGNLKEAELSTRKAIEIKPDFAAAYFNKGLIYKELGLHEDAISSFNDAYKIEPENPLYQSWKGLKPSDIHRVTLTNDKDIINSISQLDWHKSIIYLKEICIKSPKYTEENTKEFIKLWCDLSIKKIDQNSFQDLLQVLKNLIIRNKRNKDINNLYKYIFERFNLESILDLYDKNDRLLIQLSYSEYKFLIEDFPEAEILASNNIKEAEILIRDKETEDIGWLIAKRSLGLFTQIDLARNNLTNLINKLIT